MVRTTKKWVSGNGNITNTITYLNTGKVLVPTLTDKRIGRTRDNVHKIVHGNFKVIIFSPNETKVNDELEKVPTTVISSLKKIASIMVYLFAVFLFIIIFEISKHEISKKL